MAASMASLNSAFVGKAVVSRKVTATKRALKGVTRTRAVVTAPPAEVSVDTIKVCGSYNTLHYIPLPCNPYRVA